MPKKSKRSKGSQSKPLQKKYNTRFCSLLWPPINKRGYPFSKDQLVYEYAKKYVQGNNRYGVGPELGVVVDPAYGSKMLVLFFGETEAEVISKTNVRACPFGKLFPDTRAKGGGAEYTFIKAVKGGGLISRQFTSDEEPKKSNADNEKSNADSNTDNEKSNADNEKSDTDNEKSNADSNADNDKSNADNEKSNAVNEKSNDSQEVGGGSSDEEPNVNIRSPYLTNLADVLRAHGVDATKGVHSAFITKVAQIYHGYGK